MPVPPEKIDSVIRERISGAGKGNFFLRLLYVLVEGFLDEQISLRAASLVYTTLLTFVPLLAVSFSVLKAFGVNTNLEIALYYFLEPLGEKGVDISFTVIKFVENMNIAVLGAIGLSTLMYTAISMISKVESALNSIWHISEPRHLSQRFSSYLSILLVGPVFGFTAVSLLVSLKSAYVIKKVVSLPAAGPMIYTAGKISPYFLVWAVFTLIYVFLPNTRVRFKAALTGGCFAAVAWGVMGWAFTSFVASSSQYSAVYSGLAALFLFVIWIYWNWLVLLSGSRVACYVQHPAYFGHEGKEAVSSRFMEKTALSAVIAIARHFYAGKKSHADSLAAELGIPAHILQDLLTSLVRRDIITETAGDHPAYLPSRDPGAISARSVLEAVRPEGEFPLDRQPADPGIEELMRDMDNAASDLLGDTTVKDLAGKYGLRSS